jgi:hypothetical protein
MIRWSEEFGLRRAELIETYEAVHGAGRTCNSAFAPAPPKGRSVSARAEVAAQAYAEGWIGLDRVLGWAEEQELEEDETMALLERCAVEGHASWPFRS